MSPVFEPLAGGKHGASKMVSAWRRLSGMSLALLIACGSGETSPPAPDGGPPTTRDDASTGDAAVPASDAARDTTTDIATDPKVVDPDGAVTDASDGASGAGSDARRDAFDAGAIDDGGADAGRPIDRGRFTAMTYNVAGLPAILSSSDPANNTPRIGMLVNGYDMVSVQEDFNYHAALYAADKHPYRTPTTGGVPFGSGLNFMSNFVFDAPVRVKWNDCTEADCLTPKGFMLLQVAISPGVLVDVYDLHANAGSTDANMAARRANLAQLGDYIESVSAGNAVVVLGDTNTRYTRGESDRIAAFVDRLALRDVWVELSRGGVRPVPPDALMDCDGHPAAGTCEVVDKIFYRSNPLVTLTPTAFDVPDVLFRTDAGAALSDHRPVVATFDWQSSPDMILSEAFGGTGGEPFLDHPSLSPPLRVLRLAIQAGARLDNVEVRFTNGQLFGHGGAGGTMTSLTLDPTSEALTGARLCRGEKDGFVRVVYAAFQTDTGRSLVGGTETTDCLQLSAPPGFQISGFHGRASTEIDKLGFVYARR